MLMLAYRYQIVIASRVHALIGVENGYYQLSISLAINPVLKDIISIVNKYLTTNAYATHPILSLVIIINLPASSSIRLQS